MPELAEVMLMAKTSKSKYMNSKLKDIEILYSTERLNIYF